MTLRPVCTGLALFAAALVVSSALSLPVLGQSSSSSIESPGGTTESGAADAGAPAVAAGDPAAGKSIWNDAACYNCHGRNGQGGHSADFPAGPSLRTSQLDPDSMLMIIACGVPDTRMPAWLKGAYSEHECYGNPLGPAPSGVLVSGAYSEDQLRDLVAYIQTTFMRKTP